MIVRESWEVLKKDKEIMWFPVLSMIVSIVAIILFCIGIFVYAWKGDFETASSVNPEDTNILGVAVLFVFYIVMNFIANFFTAGLYIIAHGRFSGQDLSFGDGFSGAVNVAGKIFVWSLIQATVGMLLNMLANRSKLLGKIVAMILGAAWAIMTYFSLPSLVIGKKTVGDSFSESATVIRRTWGETIIIAFGSGLFFSLIIFLGIALAIGIIVLAPTFTVVLSVLFLLIVFLIGTSIVSASLGAIFKLALYEYATTGVVPSGFTPELITGAVRAG